MKWIWIGIIILMIISGVSYEFWRVLPQITYTLDFGSVFDAIVLLVIGAVVEYAYLKQSSDKRADTDLLLSIVGEAKTAFGRLEEQEHSCESGKVLTQSQQLSLNCAERELSNAVHSIEVALGHCKIDLQKLAFDKLKVARAELKESLTDTPYPGPYDKTSLISIRTAFKTMRDELTRIAFAINHR